MPIPVIKEQEIYTNTIHTILKSRFNEGEQLCLNDEPTHFCIDHLDNQQSCYSVSLNILEKETNYLLERWTIAVGLNDNSKFMRNISQFISNLPLSKCRQVDLYLITTFLDQSDKQCYSYLSNQQTTIEFKADSQLKAQRFQLDSAISIEVVYDENIKTTINFMPWSKMQQITQERKKHEGVHPLQPSSVPTIVPPTSVYSPFVAVRRLSRLSLSAMELDNPEGQTNNSSIPIPGSSSRMQYTHHNINKLSTLAFSTSPTANTRFLSPTFHTDFLGERRNSFTDSHHHGCFVGSFEESLFSGRMSSMPSKPITFHCQIGVLGYGECKPSLKCPPHWSILFPATFYKLPQQDQDYTPVTPYVGTVDIGDHALNELKKQTSPGYRLPPKGQLQVVVKNPNKTAVKLFLIPYDVTDMPKNTKTFLRQKSYTHGTKILRYAIHIQICRTEKKRIYLYKTMKVVFANQKMDAREKFDVACEGPNEPVYIPL